jgi:hypothetical protein
MKKIFFLMLLVGAFGAASAQDFAKQATTARTAYAAGKLDDSRFALQQMLENLDMMTGKEIMKILPQKMDDKPAVAAKDNVAGASGWAGVVIHREYGTGDKNIQLETITNSPLLGSLNALLSIPFIANNGDQKVVKINGYKALVQKVSGENGASDYELQLPLSSTLITLKAPGHTQDQVIAMANTIPVAQIAKMVQ